MFRDKDFWPIKHGEHAIDLVHLLDEAFILVFSTSRVLRDWHLFDAAMQALFAFPKLSEDNVLLFFGNNPGAFGALVFLDFLEP